MRWCLWIFNPLFPITVEHLSYLALRPNQPSRALPGRGGGVYEQTDAKLSITVKANSALRNSDTLLSKGLR
jgi:hypothetical protein